MTSQTNASTARSSPSYDSRYHARHAERAIKKAKLIAARIEKGSSLVDIGCNAGLISKYLMQNGNASNITGVELDQSILDPYLKNHPNFRLIEQEIQEVEFSRNYDSGIYFSVHHHIVAHHGIDVAIRTLRNIATHCRNRLLFETGKISEGSYWPWQAELRRHFRFDEEHYCYLFRCLEDLVEDFEIIGYNRIHGIRREIFELQIRPETDCERLNSQLQRHYHPNDIYRAGDPEILDIGHFTKTARIHNAGGTAFFKKSHTGNPLASYREHLISSSIPADWAVSSLGLTSDGGVLFPFIETIESDLASPKKLESSEAHALAKQLKSIQKCLMARSISLREPFGHRSVDRIIYVICDFNPSNFLLVRTESDEYRILVVDFAYQSPSYEWKNDFNIARALENLGERPLFRSYLRLRGLTRLFAKLLGHQLLSRKRRIINRFPSLFGAVFTELTNRFGAPLRRARPSRSN